MAGRSFWLDELIIENIMLSLGSSRELAGVARVCAPLRSAAVTVADDKLLALHHRLQALPPDGVDAPSPLLSLVRWEAVEAANLVWLQANPSSLILQRVVRETEIRVRGCADLSGNGHHAQSTVDSSPGFNPCALNGHGALEFDGASVLRAAPFATPLQQPVTIIVVARARGDTTIVDSHSTRCVSRTHSSAQCSLWYSLRVTHTHAPNSFRHQSPTASQYTQIAARVASSYATATRPRHRLLQALLRQAAPYALAPTSHLGWQIVHDETLHNSSKHCRKAAIHPDIRW